MSTANQLRQLADVNSIDETDMEVARVLLLRAAQELETLCALPNALQTLIKCKGYFGDAIAGPWVSIEFVGAESSSPPFAVAACKEFGKTRAPLHLENCGIDGLPKAILNCVGAIRRLRNRKT